MLQHTLTTPTAPKRVVVLGGSGFVGARLVARLREQGVETVSASSQDVDLTSPDAVTTLSGIVRKDDALVFASCLTPEKGGDLRTFMKNLAMAEHVGSFVETHACAHVIYIGSDAIFKDDVTLVTEDSEQQPAALYGTAHVAREKMMTYACGKSGTPLAILRPCAIYGAGDTHNSYGPNRFLKAARDEGKITLFGNGEETRDHIFVDDLCAVIEATLSSRSTGTLNVATGKALSFAQVAESVVAALGAPVQIAPTPRKNPVTHRHFDTAAVIKSFPGMAFRSLDDGLRSYVSAKA